MQPHEKSLNKGFLNSMKGFSLVEVVVAVLLLALVTAGILSVTLSSKKIIVRSHQRFSGTEVAQVVIESFRKYLGADEWYNASSLIFDGDWICYNLTDPDPLNVSVHFNNTAFANRHDCEWCYRIENVTNYDYRQITVNVTWDSDVPE